eukprot:10812577-Karenia_brevis.AAC.1
MNELNDFDKKFFNEGFADLKKAYGDKMATLVRNLKTIPRLNPFIDDAEFEMNNIKAMKRSRDEHARKNNK